MAFLVPKGSYRFLPYLIPVMLAFFLFSFNGREAHGARVKDVSYVMGVRPNQLVGYGLVVGLNGTGDGKKARFTVQAMANMLQKMGITISPRDIDVNNVAAVMVTADLPPFAKPGTRLDAVVSSLGDAKSLYGGTLIMTPLKGMDGEVYAVAQGPVSIGGFTAAGQAAGVQRSFPTVARVPGGVLVEKEVPVQLNGDLHLVLNQPDFTTASTLEQIINEHFGFPCAKALDATTVVVRIPDMYRNDPVGFVSSIEGLELGLSQKAKVVINERTGTVVVGENVRINTVAISHGNLSVVVKETPQVSQPLPFTQGQTTVVPETQITVTEEKRQLFLVPRGATIGELVRALNVLGVSSRDLVTIFQAIKAAGALEAELEIM